MKTAVSIADPLFAAAEQFAKKRKKTRSQLYSEALAEYLGRHARDAITEAMNRTCDAINETPDDFVAVAAHQIAMNVPSITFMIPLGLAMAATVRVGRAAGAGDLIGVRRSGYTAILIAVAFMVFSGWCVAM